MNSPFVYQAYVGTVTPSGLGRWPFRHPESFQLFAQAEISCSRGHIGRK
jgi:hypothetical protein